MCSIDPSPLLDNVATSSDKQATGERRFKFRPSILIMVGWTILVWLVSLSLELWPTILFVALGWADELLPCLTAAALILSCNIPLMVSWILATCYQKIRVLWGEEDYIRLSYFGDDYWMPRPNYEWGGPPLNITLRIWNQEDGWGGVDKSAEATDKTLHDKEGLQTFEPEVASEQYEEEQYIARQNKISQPTLVVTVCYLLERDNNGFLFESMEWFTSAYTCPIYLMMNARGEGNQRAWVHEMVCKVKESLLIKHRGQVQVTFSESSRSKAENLNAFGELVSTDKFDYALVFDIDDRPTYSERSLLKCAKSLIGTTRNGFKMIGLQGPCVDCFENEAGLFGVMECHQEWYYHTAKNQDYARFMGHSWCMGSNFIAETWVFKNYAFDPNLLTEDASWSVELLEDRMALAVLPMALSYGQLPPTPARKKRRKRWEKGVLQLCIHILRNVPMTSFTWSAKCWSFYTLMGYFFVCPLFIMLSLFGFRTIMGNCRMQTGSIFFLDPGQTVAEMNGVHGATAIVWMWNYIGFASLMTWLFLAVAYWVNALRFWHRGQFLNARQGYKWFFLQFGYIVVDTLLLLFPLLNYKYQIRQFYFTEMLLDLVFCRLPTWEPTAKLTKVCDEKKYNERDSSVTLSASDEGSEGQNSYDFPYDNGDDEESCYASVSSIVGG